MARPKEDGNFSWRNLWADLLKGAGRGLLEYDGSREAQAALAGLDVFDAAQERRRRPDQPKPGDGTYQDILMDLWPAMSPAERAAFRGLPPEQRNAWMEEWAQASSDGVPRSDDGSPVNGGPRLPVAAGQLPYAVRPISINPFDRWHLQSTLPFGADGRLNLPTYRR